MRYAEILKADAFSLTPFLFSLDFFLSVVSFKKRVQQDSLLHCGRQWTPRTRGLEHTSASFRKENRFEMSESNEPQRFEALESNVTEIQRQISELMSRVRQLTQTRTAGVGQREEELGGTGRGAAHNYSGGAGRVPPTADTSYGASAVGATAAAEVPVHSRAASEPGRPADDTSRRRVLPAGVGPMIDVQRGEARVPYLAGIAAHDEGGGVLNTDFKSLPTRFIPPVLKAEKGDFHKFKHGFLLKTNMLDITDHFVGQAMQMVPVGESFEQQAVLLREGFSDEEIRGAYQAWDFIDTALQSEADRAILKRCRSPQEVFERLEK